MKRREKEFDVDYELDPEQQQHMMHGSFPQTMQIDPRRARFPCSIVWSPLPVISWFIPCIGHIGICREDGVILDFAGPNYVCVDNFAFGSATRYFQISRDKCSIPLCQSPESGEEDYLQGENGGGRELRTWDDALLKSTQEFQHRSYSLFTCNCHSFVANNLNRLGFLSRGWNVVTLAIFILFRGRWVSTASMLRSVLPFIFVFSIGVILGGFTFLKYWFLFTSALIGWFIIGTYCFKNLIQFQICTRRDSNLKPLDKKREHIPLELRLIASLLLLLTASVKRFRGPFTVYLWLGPISNSQFWRFHSHDET
ncbi:hypothetical protein Ahy_B05g079279 isoform A [Arachis hypogaea]|uniref:Protein RTE1-HOMOLOG n=1 Tax=Arachis hypogaea TaxID=3818 RepID=A0A444Z9K3_ARAHY|nr:hypothetical protein Ahy_B05g079279 isoform A [Arachis hypogaea]